MFTIIGLIQINEYSELNGLEPINIEQNIIKIIPFIIGAFFMILSGILLYSQKTTGWIIGNSLICMVLLFPLIVIIKNLFQNVKFELLDNNKKKYFVYLCLLVIFYILYFLNKKAVRFKYNIVLKHYIIIFSITLTILFSLFVFK